MPRFACGRVRSTLRPPPRVPGVAPAVAVSVVEVVRLPRPRRHHDRDPLRRRDGRITIGANPTASVVGVQARRVDAGRPVGADPHAGSARLVDSRAPVDGDRSPTGDAFDLVVRVRRPCSGRNGGSAPSATRVRADGERRGRRRRDAMRSANAASTPSTRTTTARGLDLRRAPGRAVALSRCMCAPAGSRRVSTRRCACRPPGHDLVLGERRLAATATGSLGRHPWPVSSTSNVTLAGCAEHEAQPRAPDPCPRPRRK